MKERRWAASEPHLFMLMIFSLRRMRRRDFRKHSARLRSARTVLWSDSKWSVAVLWSDSKWSVVVLWSDSNWTVMVLCSDSKLSVTVLWSVSN